MINKRVFALLLAFALVFVVSCGTAEDHDDEPGPVGGGVTPTSFQLIWEHVQTGVGDVLHCTVAEALPWNPGFNFTQSHQAAINNAPAGTYVCNAQLQNGDWVVYSYNPNQHLFGLTVTALDGSTVLSTYTLTEADIISNNQNGGNWQLHMDVNGLLTGPGGGGTVIDDPVCLNPVPSVNAVVVLKSYTNFAFTPRVRFSGDGFTPRVMTAQSGNMYTYTYANVPTDPGDDLLYTVNFEDPTTGEYLFDENGPTGPYVVTVNGVQVSERLDDDIKVVIDPCGNIITTLVGLNFVFQPSDSTAFDVDVIFGLDSFLAYPMTLSGSQWVSTIPNVPPGRYEFNIRYLTSTYPDVAGWPDHINGTVSVNGVTLDLYDMIVYSETVPWIEPTGTPLLLVRADFLIDVYADGTVVGVNMRDSTIGIIIPLP